VTLPFSYGADVYLTRPGEELRTTDRAFRRRHLADVCYFWRAHHAHGDATHDITVDLGRALDALAAGHTGEHWQVSVALTASGTGSGRDHDHADDHGLVGGSAAAAAATAAAAHPGASMDFGDLTLRVR
jgi:hypothetical protein